MRTKQWLLFHNYKVNDLNKIAVYTYSYNDNIIFVGRGKFKYAFITNNFVKRYPKVKNKISNIVLDVIAIDISIEEANLLAKQLRVKYKDTIYKTNAHSKNAKKVKNRHEQFKEKAVYVYTKDGKFIKRCKSIGTASKQFNCSRTCIRRNAIGKYRYVKNYIFSFTKNCIPVTSYKNFKIVVPKIKPLLKVVVK